MDSAMKQIQEDRKLRVHDLHVPIGILTDVFVKKQIGKAVLKGILPFTTSYGVVPHQVQAAVVDFIRVISPQ
jgi:hypothetical protein